MSTTAPAPTGRSLAARRSGRIAVATLFALMAVLLLAAALVPLLAGAGSGGTPRPAPAPAVHP
ncbi:hypothetical protein AB0K00_25280 [Dactylosporangium sp. NPDC049525]|uniref:hypothetical protein n=1 Tax=Dactylosporangium sp. NPDC049525 TaxID=3154730 RepID=UPI00342EDC69